MTITISTSMSVKPSRRVKRRCGRGFIAKFAYVGSRFKGRSRIRSRSSLARSEQLILSTQPARPFHARELHDLDFWYAHPLPRDGFGRCIRTGAVPISVKETTSSRAAAMNAENKRCDYRQVFQFNTFRVGLSPPSASKGCSSLRGSVANLSMGGIAIIIKDEIDPSALYGNWNVSFVIPVRKQPRLNLAMPCCFIHSHPVAEGRLCGFKFLDIESPLRHHERQALWQFLLGVQCGSSRVI